MQPNIRRHAAASRGDEKAEHATGHLATDAQLPAMLSAYDQALWAVQQGCITKLAESMQLPTHPERDQALAEIETARALQDGKSADPPTQTMRQGASASQTSESPPQPKPQSSTRIPELLPVSFDRTVVSLATGRVVQLLQWTTYGGSTDEASVDALGQAQEGVDFAGDLRLGRIALPNQSDIVALRNHSVHSQPVFAADLLYLLRVAQESGSAMGMSKEHAARFSRWVRQLESCDRNLHERKQRLIQQFTNDLALIDQRRRELDCLEVTKREEMLQRDNFFYKKAMTDLYLYFKHEHVVEVTEEEDALRLYSHTIGRLLEKDPMLGAETADVKADTTTASADNALGMAIQPAEAAQSSPDGALMLSPVQPIGVTQLAQQPPRSKNG